MGVVLLYCTLLYFSRQYSHSKSRTNETTGQNTVDGARDDDDDGSDDSSSSKINKALRACTHKRAHSIQLHDIYIYLHDMTMRAMNCTFLDFKVDENNIGSISP